MRRIQSRALCRGARTRPNGVALTRPLAHCGLDRCPGVVARFQPHCTGLGAVPLHAAEPHPVGRRRAAGLRALVPGAAVRLDRAQPDAARCAVPPWRCWPRRGRRRRGAGRRVARLAAARPEPARIGAADRVSIQLLRRAGVVRTPGRRAGPGLDRGADFGVRAVVQRGRRVAAGAARRTRLPARVGAQPVDHRHASPGCCATPSR